MSFFDIADEVLASAKDPFKADVETIVERAKTYRQNIAKGDWSVQIHKEDADDGENGIGDFLDYEEMIAGVLLSAWSRKADDAFRAMVSAMGETTVSKADTPIYTAAGLQDAVTAGASLMSDLVTADDEAKLVKLHKQAARRGAAIVNGLKALDEYPKFNDLMVNMARSAKYFTNAYFNTQVVPGLYKAVETFLTSEGTTDPTDVYRMIRSKLDARLLKRVPYWHTVASSGASRAYHYGVIKAGRRLGYRGYRFVAVMDSRTSVQCQHLNGKEFWLADAEAVYDRVAAAEDDAIKDVHPWLTREEIVGLTEQEVYARAVYIPPLHGRCRSTIQLLSV